MTDREKILAYIDKIIKGLESSCTPNPLGTIEECMANAEIEALSLVIEFINSIPEEPVSEDADNAARNYADDCKLDNDTHFMERQLCVEHFKAGVKWQKKVFINKACDWLTKHAKKYYFNVNGYIGTDELVEDFKLIIEM